MERPNQGIWNTMIRNIMNRKLGRIGKDSENIRKTFGKELLNDIQRSIIELISDNSKITAKEIAKCLSVSSRTIEKHIKILKDLQILERVGGRKDGHWEIME